MINISEMERCRTRWWQVRRGGGPVTPQRCRMYFCRLETEHYRQHERKCMPRQRLIQGCSAQDQEELEAPVTARCTQGKLPQAIRQAISR